MAKKPFRADDKRRGGLGDNVPITASDNDGAGPSLYEIVGRGKYLLNSKQFSIGQGKRVA